jgi:hypothetical protein
LPWTRGYGWPRLGLRSSRFWKVRAVFGYPDCADVVVQAETQPQHVRASRPS